MMSSLFLDDAQRIELGDRVINHLANDWDRAAYTIRYVFQMARKFGVDNVREDR